MNDRIYLDYNATAPLRPEARNAMLAALDGPHNASSVHSFGRQARKLAEDARAQIAAACGVPPAQIVFNSGATEGNNTVLQYFARAYPDERILISAIEHPSVREAVPAAEEIPATPDGLIDLSALEERLKNGPKTSLVSVMWVNNETGVIQPVREAAALAHSHGALFHTDAVQALGRIDASMPENGIDFMSLSAHKIGGPQGAGALALGTCGISPALLHGGGQEKQLRAGTENIAGIAGFGAAVEATLKDMNDAKADAENKVPRSPPDHTKKLADLKQYQDQLEDELCKINKDIIIHSRAAPRVPNTTLLSLPGAKAETLLMAFDLEGIALSNGSACSSGTVKPSRVLRAMGVPENIAAGTLRISTGWNTGPEDIEKFLQIFKKVTERIKA